MGKLVTIATKARFDALREASNISETSLNFILETGLLYTHNIFINGASFGTATSNYIPVKIGGVTKNLSLNGHTHSNYYDNSSDIDIGSNKIKSGTLELLKYSSDTLILGNSSIPTEFFGTLKTTKDGTKYTILDTNNFSIVNKTSTNLTLNNVALFKYGSSSFQLDYVRRYNTVETFNNLAKYTSAGTTNENSKAYGFITLSTDTGTNTYSYAQIRVSIPDNTLEFRTSSDTTWKGTLLGGVYRNITINGTTYSIVTKAGSLPTIIAPTALGTSGQYLTTSDDGKSLTWRTLPTDNNTWRPIAVNGTEKRSSNTGSGNLDIINGTNTTIEWTSGNKLKINAVDTWTAWKGATDSANGTAGYMPAPTSAQRGQFLRGDGSWVSLNNYSLPTASSSTLGGVKTGAAITDTTGYTAVAIKDGIIYYKDTNTTYTFYNLLFQNSGGTTVDTYKPTTSPTKTLKAGANVTISAASNVITIASTNTWNANAVGVAGYVAAPTKAANANMTWLTDAEGIPAWRASNNHSHSYLPLNGKVSYISGTSGANSYVKISGAYPSSGSGYNTCTYLLSSRGGESIYIYCGLSDDVILSPYLKRAVTKYTKILGIRYSTNGDLFIKFGFYSNGAVIRQIGGGTRDLTITTVTESDYNAATDVTIDMILDSSNSSVSLSGSTLSVKINGTTLSLTNTWRGILNNLTSDSTTDSLSAAQGKALNDKFGSYLPLSGGTLTGNLSFSNSGTGFRGINYGTMGDNDQWRIGGAATGSNAGYMEIATADDGAEPIYVRQYTGVFSTLKRTATLLDGSGNTSFPGTVSASSFSGNVTGNCSGSAGSVAWANVTGKPLSGDSGNNGPVWGNYVPVKSDGVMEIGKYLDFHNSSNDGVDYAVRLTCQGNNKVVVNLPTSTGTLALTSQIPTVNNASLTIQSNGTTITTFTANLSSNTTFNLVPGSGITFANDTNNKKITINTVSSMLNQGEVIDTHGEGNATVVLGLNSKMGGFYERGGTCDAYEVSASTTDFTGTLTKLSTLSSLSASIFDGFMGYYGSYTGDNFAVYDLRLPLALYYGSSTFWSFGNGSWAPKKIRVLSSVDGTNWILCYSNDNCPAYGKTRLLYPSGQYHVLYIRFVFNKYSRISFLGGIDYEGNGGLTLYMTKYLNDPIYRHVTPGKNNTYILGSSSAKWSSVYATTFYGDLSGNATSASTTTKLQTTRTLWGQSFDGSANVTGDMSSVGNISFSATGKNIAGLEYFDTTNNRIGVHTSSPTGTLHVHLDNQNGGSTKLLPALRIDGKVDLYDNVTNGGTKNSMLNLLFNGTHEYGTVIKIHSYGNDSPTIRFSRSTSIDDINNQVNTAWSVGMSYNSAYGFCIAKNRGITGWGTEVVTIDSSENVGIGTTSPSYKLHVNGSINGTSIYLNGTALSTASTHAHGDYVTTIGTSGNTLTWSKGGAAQTAITVPYATNADLLDGYHESSFLRHRDNTSTNGESTLWSQIGIRQYYGALPDGLSGGIYNWGQAISFAGNDARFDIYASHQSSNPSHNGNGVYYRSGWGGNKQPWVRFLDSNNSSVSKSGETLTVKINGTSQSLTNTNTWRGITDTYNPTTADSATSLSQKGAKDLFDKLTISAGRWSWGGNGSYGFCLIATIDTNAIYLNYPITFEISGRSMALTHITIAFKNSGTVDPAVDYFCTDYSTRFYLYKSATNTWKLYGLSPDGVWGSLYLYRVKGGSYSRVTVNMEGVSALPEGYLTPTFIGNVSYATSSGSVAWGNVSSKPETATRWPAWSEVTGKPSTFTPSSHNHDSVYAKLASHNNLTASGNEFTFASSGFSGGIYFNYRTAGGTNGNITEYIFGNGKGGALGTAIHSGNWSSYITLSSLGAAAASHSHNYLPKLDWWTYEHSHSVDSLTSGTTFAYTSHGAPVSGTIVAFSCTSNNYPLQLQGSYAAESLYFRNLNGDNGTWNTWRYVIHSGNIGSQTVSNSDMCDGLHVHSGRNNEANKIVRTDGNGYIQCDWINTTSGGFYPSDAAISRVYCSNDGYLRYLSPSDFISKMGILSLSGGTMTGALTVKLYIFGYNYNHAGSNAPSFVFDKPGSNYTGIGANGEADTIYFSAATISNGEASWVTSYKQKWKFNGTIHATGGNMSGHIYLTGAVADSSTSNTSQIVFGTSSNLHVVISSNTKAIIINPSTGSTTGQTIIGVDTVESAFGSNVKAPNFYTTSDRNKKQNISSLSEHIRKFQLKDTEKWHYGVIAQEVEEMFRDGEEGNMTVNYNSVLSYYVGSLENSVAGLEAAKRLLENKVASLEKELNSLKQKLK